MNSDYFISVFNPEKEKAKWIEDTDEAKKEAAEEGFIYQSVYMFPYKPEPSKDFPPSTGDLFLIAFVRDDPPVGILALRKLLRGISSMHPELDLSMLGYYMDNHGIVSVRIPASLFGGESFSPYQRNYHRRMIDIFLAYTNSYVYISLNDHKRRYRHRSDELTLEDIITPCIYPPAENYNWLPPENSNYRHFTVELDDISFMNDSVDALWEDVKADRSFEVRRTPAHGKALEKVYQTAQFTTICCHPSRINERSLSQCEVYKNITKKPNSLSIKQLFKAIELLEPLGNSRCRELKRAFVNKAVKRNPRFTKDSAEKIFWDIKDKRRLPSCSELKDCFDCKGDCGVQNPYELQEKDDAAAHNLANFRMKDDGLYYSPSAFKDANDQSKLCSEFRIVAKVGDFDSDGWAKRVEIRAPDGAINRIVIPNEEAIGTGDTLIKILVQHGLELTYLWCKRYIKEYFLLYTPDQIFRVTDKLGWHDNSYVFPEQNIGFNDFPITYTDAPDKFQEVGTLKEWQDNVAKYCEGNTLLMLLVAFALSGPLLSSKQQEGGGLHLYGPSSIGKTTLAHVTGSVCGGIKNKGYINQWRTTDNALERVAARHNDSTLILGEIGQASAETVNHVSYMLANGQGKERANVSTGKTYTWRVNCLSTGELPFSEKIAETGKYKAMAGQEVRMIDLPVLAAGKYGIFEELHGCENGNEFSHLLKSNALSCFGSPLRAFVKALCGTNKDEKKRNEDEIKASIDSFVNDNCPKNCSEQVQRVLNRFALIALAGEFACRNGILPWSEADARDCAVKWFNIWLEERGTLGSKEIENAITNIKEHWNRNGDTHYIDLDDTENKRFNKEVSGYYWKDQSSGETVLLIKTEIFNDLTRRANRKELMEELDKRGFLARDGRGELLVTKWISGDKRNVRGVRLLPSKWGGKVEDKDTKGDMVGKEHTGAKLLDPNDPEPDDCF